MRAGLAALVICIAGAAQAVPLQLPSGARQMVERNTQTDRFSLPLGPFAQGAVPMQTIEGDVQRAAWRIDQAGLTPLQVLDPLRSQLEAAGYETLLDCAALTCGGYDFRFAIEVLPAPNMHVSLRNFHVLSARRGGAGVMIVASATSGASFVQIIQAGPAAQLPPEAPQIAVAAPSPAGDLAQQLARQGHAVLASLDFESGSSALGAGPFAMLEELAQVLLGAPQMRLALVGHTDSIGALEGNIALSRARAQAVRARLIEAYGIAPDRLEAEGMGYLAPLTTNDTEAGREANRRVEAVVLEN